MIDYCIKMPEKEEYQRGHRYPYYSCEVLCSINGLNIDKLLNTPTEHNDNLDLDKEKKEDNCNKNKNNEDNEKEKITDEKSSTNNDKYS